VAVDTTTVTPSGLDVYPPIIAGGGGGGGAVNSVTPGDETIIIEGTPTDPTVRNNTTDILETSVNVVPGLWVNVYDSAGTPKIRLADASLGQGYQCDGFVVDTVLAGNTVKIYTDGMNTHVSGMVASEVWLGNAGLGTNTPPTTVGYISQQIGIATSATEVAFEPQPDILIAAPGSAGNNGSSISIEITTTQNITISNVVGAGWITMVGAGGGGKSSAAAAVPGGGGGGAGEYCQNFMIPFTPGETITVNIGAKGVGGTAGAAGTDGGSTSIVCAAGTFLVLGGKGATVGTGGAGGGVSGGTGGAAGNPGGTGRLGAAESPVHFGGSSGGGAGTVANSTCGTGGGAPGRLTGGAAGVINVSAAPGGGGAASVWGNGGAGGTTNAPGVSAAATAYGAGGGGAGGNTGASQAGGDGAPGYCLIMYVA
jgi:hypothetical protein